MHALYWVLISLAFLTGLWMSGPVSIYGWKFVRFTCLMFVIFILIGLK